MHFTVRQAAERLAVSDEHVLDLIHLKKLSAVNVGLGRRRPRWRITAEALAEFEASRTSTQARPAAPRKRRQLPGDVEPVYPV